jgi:hypothetical protein
MSIYCEEMCDSSAYQLKAASGHFDSVGAAVSL